MEAKGRGLLALKKLRMPSRDFRDLCQDMQKYYRDFQYAMHKDKILWICTCTYRSQIEQDELYAQGRTKPGRIVTRTLNSKHTEKKAFDIAIVDAIGRPLWGALELFKRAGAIGRSIGLTWGGDWDSDGLSEDEKWIDLPHYQLRE